MSIMIILLVATARASEHGRAVARWVRGEATPIAAALNRSRYDPRAACPHPVDPATCAHKNNRVPCAPLGRRCRRPCGAFSVKLYGCGGVTIREGLLLHVWGSEPAAVQVEGASLADPRLLAKARAYRPHAKFVIALREPIDRILSRYWSPAAGVAGSTGVYEREPPPTNRYGGRWPQGGPPAREAHAPITLEAWIDAVEAEAGRRQLFNCVSNYYVKTLVGWDGKPRCDASAPGCVGGVGPADAAEARGVLADAFDVVLVTEWLSHPATRAYLRRRRRRRRDEPEDGRFRERFWSSLEIPCRDEHRLKNQPEQPQSEREGGASKTKLRQRYLAAEFCFETVSRPFPRAKRQNANVSEDALVSPSARPASTFLSVENH